MSSSPYWKIKWARTKQKHWKRNQKKNRESKKNEWKREMNKKTMKKVHSWIDPWLRSPWNTFWAYLSFLSKPRTLAYITYLKSSFWLNVDTWTEEVCPWEKIFIINKAVVFFSSAKKKSLDKSSTYLGWILNCQVHSRTVKNEWKKWKWKEKITLGWKPERAV